MRRLIVSGVLMAACFTPVDQCDFYCDEAGGGGGGGSAGGSAGGRAGGSGGGGGVVNNCNASTCANGCCASSVCISATPMAQNATTCGTGGQLCMQCSPGATCNQGVCKTAVDAGFSSLVGGACSDSSACAALGMGSTCRTMTPQDHRSYPGGYCTISGCEAMLRPCPSDAICIAGGLTSLGESMPLCLKKCSVSTDSCRNPSGYRCYAISGSSDVGVCFIR